MPLPADVISNLILLDEEGDAILDVEDQTCQKTFEFRISTKVLCLASKYFVKIFGPNFEEGQRLRQGNCPHIKLVDDDPRTIHTMLAALHYQDVSELRPMDAERLATLAVHCDKYTCTDALRPLILSWLTDLEPIKNPADEFGFLLLTTYMLDSSKQFKDISARAISEVTAGFSDTWGDHETLSLLPRIVESKPLAKL